MQTKPIVFTAILLLVTPFLIHTQQVGPDGSFTYTYPIKLPPGTGGIQPKLALTYNSNAGNSMCGVGWNLSGLPAITRDRSYDVNFDENDHYRYGGQRLIYSGADGYFHTEKEKYLRIAAYDAAACRTGPIADIAYWVVTQKNGTKMYFGYYSNDHTEDTDGRIDAVGKGGKALLWLVNKMEDVHGNYYYVQYTEDTENGDYYPEKITYTKGNGLVLENIVEFVYEDRTDHGTKYIPTPFDMDKRLKEIIIKVKDTHTETVHHKYSLNYNYSELSKRSIIKSIDALGAEDTILQSTDFGWSDASVNISYLGEHPTNRRAEEADIPTKFIPGDFNGDGMSDLVMARGEESGTDRYIFYTYLGNEDGTLSWLRGSFDTQKKWQYENIPNRLLPGDYNGDGQTDLVMARGARINDLNQYVFDIYLSNEEGRFEYRGECLTNRVWQEGDIPTRFIPGDFNGDGKADLIMARGETNDHDGYDSYVLFIYNGTGDGWLTFKGGYDTNRTWQEGIIPTEFLPGDYNGDGRSDLIIARGETNNTDYEYNTYVFYRYLGTEDGTLTYIPGCYNTNRDWKEGCLPTQFVTGDFNGDGYSDVIMARGDDDGRERYKLYTYLGKGHNWPTYLGEYDTDNDDIDIHYSHCDCPGGRYVSIPVLLLPGDFNGDRKLDLIIVGAVNEPYPPGMHVLYKYQSNEEGKFIFQGSYNTNRVW